MRPIRFVLAAALATLAVRLAAAAPGPGISLRTSSTTSCGWCACPTRTCASGVRSSGARGEFPETIAAVGPGVGVPPRLSHSAPIGVVAVSGRWTGGRAGGKVSGGAGTCM